MSEYDQVVYTDPELVKAGQEIMKRRRYEPLDTLEWEGMHIDAEVALLTGKEEAGDVMRKLSSHIFRMSEEIRRLRHKSGEEVWHCCSTTKEQDEEERLQCRAT